MLFDIKSPNKLGQTEYLRCGTLLISDPLRLEFWCYDPLKYLKLISRELVVLVYPRYSSLGRSDFPPSSPAFAPHTGRLPVIRHYFTLLNIYEN